MVLQTIRDRLSGIVAIFILLLLAIPFAFVGVNSYFQSGSTNMVALVDDTEITFTEFNQSFLNYRRRVQSIMGPAFDAAEFDSPIARREHLERMIDDTVLRNVVTGLDLDVDDDRLAERIRAIPSFQVDGQFNLEVYQAQLASQGRSAPQFENELRESLLMGQLPAGVRLSSFTTNSELKEYVALSEQTRTFSVVSVPADVEAVQTTFSDEEIAAWYEAHEQDFKTEEQVVIQYLEMNASDMSTFAEPDEETLRSRFETQKGRFISPEQRLVSHVLIQIERDADDATRETLRQQAQDIADRARAGEDFATLATENSQDLGSAGRGGDLGWIAPGDMVEAFENATYELSMSAPVSDPVETNFGWHVIQLREIEEASGQNFEEARETLVDEYRQEEAEREFLDIADRVVDIVYEDPTTLEAASLDTGIPLFMEGPFGRGGGEGLSANAEVVRAAFSDLVLLQGSVSDPVDIDLNHMILLRVDEHFPVATKPLEEVRGDIEAALRQEAANKAAEARANELLASLEAAGGTLAEVATAAGLEVLDVPEAPRQHAEPDGLVVTSVFKLPVPAEGEAINAVVEAADGYALVSLSNVTDGELPEGSVLGSRQFRRQMENTAAGIESKALIDQLRSMAEVQVFEENLGVAR
jgi:peptidyl-prolyl cis-trans isomerase D